MAGVEPEHLVTTPTFCPHCDSQGCPTCEHRGWVLTEITFAELRERLRPERPED